MKIPDKYKQTGEEEALYPVGKFQDDLDGVQKAAAEKFKGHHQIRVDMVLNCHGVNIGGSGCLLLITAAELQNSMLGIKATRKNLMKGGGIDGKEA